MTDVGSTGLHFVFPLGSLGPSRSKTEGVGALGEDAIFPTMGGRSGVALLCASISLILFFSSLALSFLAFLLLALPVLLIS